MNTVHFIFLYCFILYNYTTQLGGWTREENLPLDRSKYLNANKHETWLQLNEILI